MTKKLQLFTLTLCLSLLGIINTAKAVTTYTYTGGGHPELTSNWGKTTATIGSHPSDFVTANQTFKFTSTGSATLGGDWVVSGAGSKVIVGDGTHAFTFSDGGHIANFSGISGSGGVSVASTCTLVIGNVSTSFPNISTGFVTNTGSTVNYATAAGAQTVFQPSAPFAYDNLTICGGATFTLAGAIAVSHILNICAGSAFVLNGLTVNLNGTITGTGTITGDISAGINIQASSNFGTIYFTAGHRTLDVFTISNGAVANVVTLGTDLTISDDGGGSSTFNFVQGTLNLNGHALITDGTCFSASFPSSATGIITGSSTSSLQISCDPTGAIGGNVYMDQTTDGSTNALSNLTLNDGGSGSTLTIGANLDIIDSLSLTSGTLDASGSDYITLVADQATVGHVGRIGVVGGTYMGNIISQVYHDPAGNETNWALMGVAGVTNTTFVDWDRTFKITCPTCPDGDGSAQNQGNGPFTSIDTYDETVGLGDPNNMPHYVGIPSIGTTIANGVGYWVYMGTNQPQDPTPGEFITVTGTPQIGSTGWTLTNSNGGALTDGWNALANPYPSPISWTKLALRNSNVITTYYAYNSVTQAYSTYMVGGGTTQSGSYAIGDVIPTGLGFYVQTTAASMPFNIQEGDKTAGNQILGKMANPNQVQSVNPNFNLVVDGVNATALHEEAAIWFNPNSTTGLDAYDAIAFPWNGVLQITTVNQGKNFAINGMPSLTQNYSIPVKILSGTTAQYTISTKNLQSVPAGACVKLHDNYGVMPDQDLHAGAFTVTINDSETVARFVLNITITPLAITTNTVNASCHAKNDGLITVVGNDAGPWNYIWKDASGTVVKTSLNKATADTLTGLNNGVYSVDVSTVGSCNSATQTFTVTAPAAAASAFTAPSQVNAGDNVVLTNNSANATNYVWNFGDGDISSMQTPTYVYNNAGTYTITLQAINVNCNDTASSTQVITVNATMGIKQANAGDGDINLSRDASGNYIQFNYTNQTKVNITVYNVLGQVVLNDAELSVVNDKIYINIATDKNQVLYVTITNLNTNKQTTKKFLND